MTRRRLFTVGVYGRDGEEFSETLLEYSVDAIIDIRARRGVRGAGYAWSNSTRLQTGLSGLGVAYLHAHELAPPEKVRDIQRSADLRGDVAKRQRVGLASSFSAAYEREVLDRLDRNAIASQIYAIGERPALLCVEASAPACHRSLVAEWISSSGEFDVTDL